jgi:hypothetical protein
LHRAAADSFPHQITVCFTVPALAPKSVVAAKLAVIVKDPVDDSVTVTEALPPDKVAVPRFVEPFMNVTVPVGVTPLAVTVAVKVTAAPLPEGFLDETTVVVVAAAFTTWLRAAELPGRDDASPLYKAVIEAVPTGRVAVDKVATPAESVPVPITMPPFSKVMVPVGVGPADVTFAVKVTACPYAEGFALDVNVVVVALRLTVCWMAGEVLPWKLLSPP